MKEINLLPNVKILKTSIHSDYRGYFTELYSTNWNEELANFKVVQVNFVHSKLKNTLRGLHFQKGDYSQGKVITCISGSIMDVIVDINPESDYYKHHCKITISSDNMESIFIPKGYAHGYLTLSDNVQVIYMVDNMYNPLNEVTLNYKDFNLDINWGVEEENLTLSQKDKNGISLAEMEEKI
jgi:dTDP-4-dehydrorhamnose 3,5-epimerase